MTRPVDNADLTALIGVLALYEADLLLGVDSSHLTDAVTRRFRQAGLLPAEAGRRELRQAVNDLNHRLRYAAGEYEEPPVPSPLSDND